MKKLLYSQQLIEAHRAYYEQYLNGLLKRKDIANKIGKGLCDALFDYYGKKMANNELLWNYDYERQKLHKNLKDYYNIDDEFVNDIIEFLNERINNLPMKREEENLQIACVRWFRYQYPNIIIHHSPNGGLRNAIEASKFKGMGVTAGFPDLFIPVPNKKSHGLFIELKSSTGKLSEKQADIIQRLVNSGYTVVVVNKLEFFIKFVNDYMNGLD